MSPKLTLPHHLHDEPKIYQLQSETYLFLPCSHDPRSFRRNFSTSQATETHSIRKQNFLNFKQHILTNPQSNHILLCRLQIDSAVHTTSMKQPRFRCTSDFTRFSILVQCQDFITIISKSTSPQNYFSQIYLFRSQRKHSTPVR